MNIKDYVAEDTMTIKKNRFVYLAHYDEYMSQNPMYRLRLQQVNIRSRPPFCISQAGILFSGVLLILSWRYLADKFLMFEAAGFGVLGEIWCILVAATILAMTGCQFTRLRKSKRRSNPAKLQLYNTLQHEELLPFNITSRKVVDDWCPGSPAAEYGYDPSIAGYDPACPKWLQPRDLTDDVTWNEVSEVAIPSRPSARTADAPPCKVPEPDSTESGLEGEDVKADTSRTEAALQALRESQTTADQARHLYSIAERVLSDLSQMECIAKDDGFEVILRTVESLTSELKQPDGSVELSAAALQASWVLLLVSKGSHSAKAAWVAKKAVPHSVLLMFAVADAECLTPDVKSTILRNLCWMLFTLCDANATNQPAAQNLTQHYSHDAACALLEAGGIPLLGTQVALLHGLEAASFAAPLLGLLCQMTETKEQVSEASLGMLLQPECLHGLCYVLYNQVSDERCKTMLNSMLHYLVSHKALKLLRALTTEHLVGSFLRAMPSDLRRLFICNLLSSSGQEVMLQIENEFQLDVPIALGQVIPSDCHLILPGSATPDGDCIPPTCTCALTCRLMLLRDRLPELVAAFFEEVGAESAAGESETAGQGTAAGGEGMCAPSEVVLCMLELASFLMRQDLEIQKFKHIRGQGIDCSSSSNATSVCADDTRSCSSDSLAVSAQSSVRNCLLPGSAGCSEITSADESDQSAVRTEGSSCRSCRSDRVSDRDHACSTSCTEPTVSGRVQPMSRAAHGSSVGQVVFFNTGKEVIEVDFHRYQKLKQASSFLRSVLIRTDKQSTINVLRVPQFSDEENAWAFGVLLAWADTGTVEQLDPESATCLWQAAEFFQVDDLQVHCEDMMASMMNKEPVMRAAFELGANHLSGLRLLHLCTSHMLQNLGQVVNTETFRYIHSKYRVQLQSRIVQEVRDRLTALCTLNGGVALELPNVALYSAH